MFVDFRLDVDGEKGFCSESVMRARVMICRYAIARFFPAFGKLGMLAYSGKVPAIVSLVRFDYLTELRELLFLPSASIVFATVDDLDHVIMELKKTDIFVPVLVLGTAGDGLNPCSPLKQVATIAKHHHLWFHVEGLNVCTKASRNRPEGYLAELDWVDSFSFNPSLLFDFSFSNNPVTVTFLKRLHSVPPELTHSVQNLKDESYEQAIVYGPLTLNLWYRMICNGTDALVDRCSTAVDLSMFFYEQISAHNGFLRLVNRPKGSYFITFKAQLEDDKYSNSTTQIIYHHIQSFFDPDVCASFQLSAQGEHILITFNTFLGCM